MTARAERPMLGAQLERSALLAEIRAAFDGDSVVAKNLALRRAHIALSGASTLNDEAEIRPASQPSTPNDE